MVWDSTNISKPANKQGFFRNKDGLADKPNHSTVTQQSQAPLQAHTKSPMHPIPQAGNSTYHTQPSQQPFPIEQAQGIGTHSPDNYSRIHQLPQQQQQQHSSYSPISDPSLSPTSANYQPTLSKQQPQRSVGAKTASEVTDKITGARMWSKDSANKIFPQDDNTNSPRRNRSSSMPLPLEHLQQTPPQQTLLQRQPDPLPAGYNPRASLNSSINNSRQGLPPHAPTHLPPIGHQSQSIRPTGGDLNSSMNNIAPHTAFATTPIANGGYTSPPTTGGGGVYYGMLPQISPMPSSDLVQLVMRNYEEAQRSYLSVR